MHSLFTSFVLGYHGCDKEIGERILGGESFRRSQNPYDWLGAGVYFWEANPRRALDFAQEFANRKRLGGEIRDPFVLGAVIDLGLCLDLHSANGIRAVQAAYARYKDLTDTAGVAMPRNQGRNALLRHLDCAVIEYLHEIRQDQGQPALDSVRGVFLEGGPAYPESGFAEKTHIQICVRNEDKIKGVFRVRPSMLTD